jgi:hypothetical protein
MRGLGRGRPALLAVLPLAFHGPAGQRGGDRPFVCDQLVKAMGGRIWARPRPEGGSEFGIGLKVHVEDAADEPMQLFATGATRR